MVNTGDLMQIWTNDHWKSTVHRVVVPDHEMTERLALAFFHHPAYDARIECIPSCTSAEDSPRHDAVLAGEWLDAMFEKTQASY